MDAGRAVDLPQEGAQGGLLGQRVHGDAGVHGLVEQDVGHLLPQWPEPDDDAGGLARRGIAHEGPQGRFVCRPQRPAVGGDQPTALQGGQAVGSLCQAGPRHGRPEVQRGAPEVLQPGDRSHAAQGHRRARGR